MKFEHDGLLHITLASTFASSESIIIINIQSALSFVLFKILPQDIKDARFKIENFYIDDDFAGNSVLTSMQW